MVDINKWNNDVLSSHGIKHRSYAHKVVRSVGDAKRATLWDGTVVERTDYIWVDGHGLVKCAPYELHFLYRVEDVKKKGWGLYCTCGSIGGVVGMRAYSKLASPTDDGKMIVCVMHTTLKQNEGIGRHADGSTE